MMSRTLAIHTPLSDLNSAPKGSTPLFRTKGTTNAIDSNKKRTVPTTRAGLSPSRPGVGVGVACFTYLPCFADDPKLVN